MLSAIGNGSSSLQKRHFHGISTPSLTALIYVSLVIPVPQRRCCHLSHPSHSNVSWRVVAISEQETIKFFHVINYFDLFNVAYLLSYERCSCERVAIYLIAGFFILTVPSLKYGNASHLIGAC